MAHSPYTPPKAQLADLEPQRPKLWGRATWLHLPVFAGLALMAFVEREGLTTGLDMWGVLPGLGLTGVLLYFPIRALRHMSQDPPPWWTDVLYYASVAVFLAGVELEDANVIVAGGTPTLLLNGVLGIAALFMEQRRQVRIYISGRRYIFSAPSAL